MSIPSSIEEARTTVPYYRSSYVFVSLKKRHLSIRSFDDPKLKRLRIGVQIMQNEGGSATPPAEALMDRQLSNQIIWYRIIPDFSRQNPAAALLEGVQKGDIDVAVAWGPLAGYCARTSAVPLDVVSVSPEMERATPLAFDISMGVRRSDFQLWSELNSVIEHRQPEIRRLLTKYGIPLDSQPAQRAGLAQASVAGARP